MSFTSDLNSFAINTGRHTDEVIRAFNLDLTKQVTQLTPVGDPDLWASKPPAGYTGGQAKGNWFASIGAPSTKIDKNIRAKNNAKPVNAAKAAIENSAGAVYYLTNNLPYIRRLEYEGHSSQAPAGFVRITMAKADRLLKLQARRASRQRNI